MLKFKNLAELSSLRYQEISQPNPLRWQLVKHTGDDEFTCVTHQFRCKDFFNDFVMFHNTSIDMNPYGMVINKELFESTWSGLPILLHEVKSGWEHNIYDIINPYLDSQRMPPIVPYPQEGNRVFINIPVEYLKCTFYISTLTLLLRVANLAQKLENWEQLRMSLATQEKPLFAAMEKRPISKMPEAQKKFITYWNKESGKEGNYTKENAKAGYDFVSMTHNCGILAWDRWDKSKSNTKSGFSEPIYGETEWA